MRIRLLGPCLPSANVGFQRTYWVSKDLSKEHKTIILDFHGRQRDRERDREGDRDRERNTSCASIFKVPFPKRKALLTETKLVGAILQHSARQRSPVTFREKTKLMQSIQTEQKTNIFGSTVYNGIGAGLWTSMLSSNPMAMLDLGLSLARNSQPE